jgi:hypothetical protein
MTGQALGPFETSSDAMLAVRPEDGSFAGREALFDLLKDTLQAAGVSLAGWDWTVLRWLAGLDVQTVAPIAGWVGRASGQLAGEAGDTRRLDAIRGMLGAFDWEHGDRQYALEAIERIAEGGQP